MVIYNQGTLEETVICPPPCLPGFRLSRSGLGNLWVDLYVAIAFSINAVTYIVLWTEVVSEIKY